MVKSQRRWKAHPWHATIWLLLVTSILAVAQTAPASPDRPWHSRAELQIVNDAKLFNDARLFPQPGFQIDPAKIYSLVELIDIAEAHNPDTRVAWENARAQAATLGIAQSELYPLLSAAVVSRVQRYELPFNTLFYQQTVPEAEVAFELTYTVFDFGARRGRINEKSARLLAANFQFNDVHRKIIFQVQQAYYRLLNARGLEAAAMASLANAQTVQQAAEARLQHGLATLPDVLEARSATAQAQYDLQAILGAEQVTRGDLATALGAPSTLFIPVQPLSEVSTPESISETVEQAISRALLQRPDLLAALAGIREADAQRKQARAAYYPHLDIRVRPAEQELAFHQQSLPWEQITNLTGELNLSLNWTIFDGGARKNRLAQAEADVRRAQAQVSSARDEVEDEVWTAYSNLNTAFRQREAATALLEAASQSYAAALESYNYGVRSLLDVTAAQRVLARARSTDVTAQTQILTSLADLAFRVADSIQVNTRKQP